MICHYLAITKRKEMIKPLREIWMKIRLEKLDIHKGVIVKALLDSRVTELFMNTWLAMKHEFKLRNI